MANIVLTRIHSEKFLSNETYATNLSKMPKNSNNNKNPQSLPPVVPIQSMKREVDLDDDDMSNEDADYSWSPSNESDSGRDTRQNSRHSIYTNKPKKTIGNMTKPSPYSSTLKPNQFVRNNSLIRKQQQRCPSKETDSIIQTAKTERRLKYHELQNEIQALRAKQKDLELENKLLKRMQRRQAVALKRYEGHEGELPSLIRGHEEEVRVVREQLRKTTEKLRTSERHENKKTMEVEKCRVQLQRLQTIVRDQHLDERTTLTKKVADLETENAKKDKTIRDLQHHLMLTEKNFKHQLAIEFARHKDTKKRFTELQIRVDKLSTALKEKERELEIRNIYSCHVDKSPKQIPVPLKNPNSPAKSRRRSSNLSNNSAKGLIGEQPSTGNDKHVDNEDEYELDANKKDVDQELNPTPLENTKFFSKQKENLYQDESHNLRMKQITKLPNIHNNIEMAVKPAPENLTPNLRHRLEPIHTSNLNTDDFFDRKETTTGNMDQSFAGQTGICTTKFHQSVTMSPLGVSFTARLDDSPLNTQSNSPENRRKANLMHQLFGNADNPPVPSLHDDDFTRFMKLDFETISSTEVGRHGRTSALEFEGFMSPRSGSGSALTMLPRRRRERSNVLPKKEVNEIPGSLDDSSSPIFL